MTRLVFALVLLASSLGAAENESTNLVPLEKWLAFQRSVRAVEADFIQVRELRTLRNGLRSEGKVWVDYSGKRFRWQTGDAADPKTIAVKNGGILTVIQPGRKRAERIDLKSAQPSQGPGAALDFATGDLPDTLAELRAAFTIGEFQPLSTTGAGSFALTTGGGAGAASSDPPFIIIRPTIKSAPTPTAIAMIPIS